VLLPSRDPRKADRFTHEILTHPASNGKDRRPFAQGNRAKKFWTNGLSAESVAIHCFANWRIAVESSADETGALCETVVFLGYFKDLPDARQSGKVKYPLDEILLLCLLAMVAGAETITDIARFGRLKLALLRRFRPFEDGTPAHDHLGDILATLDTEAIG
jgi:hypothetical protein